MRVVPTPLCTGWRAGGRESRETPRLVSALLQHITPSFGHTRQEDFQEMEGAEEHPWPAPATTSTAGSLAPGQQPACPPAQGWGLSSPPSLAAGERQKAK